MNNNNQLPPLRFFLLRLHSQSFFNSLIIILIHLSYVLSLYRNLNLPSSLVRFVSISAPWSPTGSKQRVLPNDDALLLFPALPFLFLCYVSFTCSFFLFSSFSFIFVPSPFIFYYALGNPKQALYTHLSSNRYLSFRCSIIPQHQMIIIYAYMPLFFSSYSTCTNFQ